MACRKGRTLAQVEAQRVDNELERQNYFKELKAEEQRKDLERAQEQAQDHLDEYKERRPAPPKRDRWGNLKNPVVEDTPVGPLEEWQTYEQALTAYEERRRYMAARGLTIRQAPPSPPREERDQLTEAERHRRAMLGIPPKVRGYGRPPWA